MRKCATFAPFSLPSLQQHQHEIDRDKRGSFVIPDQISGTDRDAKTRVKLQRQSSDADEDPIRYQNGRTSKSPQSYWAYLSTSSVAHGDICLVYPNRALLIFVAFAAIRETVRGDSDLPLLLLGAESGSIRSRSDHGACVACGVHRRSKCVGGRRRIELLHFARSAPHSGILAGGPRDASHCILFGLDVDRGFSSLYR